MLFWFGLFNLQEASFDPTYQIEPEPMSNINAAKLTRLKNHIQDEGEVTVANVARVLGARPENVGFLRDYVEAAAAELERPDTLEEFEASVVASEQEDQPAEESDKTPKEAPLENKAPRGLPENGDEVVRSTPAVPIDDENAEASPTDVAEEAGVDDSPPEAQGPTNEPGPKGQQGEPGADLSQFTYRYVDTRNIVHDLRFKRMKGNIVLLDNEPDDEIVKVRLAGKDEQINLTELQKLGAGDTYTLSGKEYPVATLIVIAQAAK